MSGHCRCVCNIPLCFLVMGIIGVAAIVLYHHGYIPIPSDNHCKNDTTPTNNTTPSNYTNLNVYDDVTEINRTISGIVKRSIKKTRMR